MFNFEKKKMKCNKISGKYNIYFKKYKLDYRLKKTLYFSLKLESLKDEKDKELFNLREQSQRIQVQLNQGHSGFKEFKEKKLKEINELNAIIENLKVLKKS